MSFVKTLNWWQDSITYCILKAKWRLLVRLEHKETEDVTRVETKTFNFVFARKLFRDNHWAIYFREHCLRKCTWRTFPRKVHNVSFTKKQAKIIWWHLDFGSVSQKYLFSKDFPKNVCFCENFVNIFIFTKDFAKIYFIQEQMRTAA